MQRVPKLVVDFETLTRTHGLHIPRTLQETSRRTRLAIRLRVSEGLPTARSYTKGIIRESIAASFPSLSLPVRFAIS